MILDKFLKKYNYTTQSFADKTGIHKKAMDTYRSQIRCPDLIKAVKIIEASGGLVTAYDLVPKHLRKKCKLKSKMEYL